MVTMKKKEYTQPLMETITLANTMNSLMAASVLGSSLSDEIAIGDNPDENLAPKIILFGEDIEFPE